MNGVDRSSEAPLLHGGDLHEAQALFPVGPRPWIDLSTGINPQAYPSPPLQPESLARLPSPGDVARLEAIAARAYGVVDPELVAAAPGTQAIIQMLPRLRPAGRVAVMGPTYAEHARSWARAGHDVHTVTSLAQADAADVAVVVNPNNPDGRRIAPPDLARAAHTFAARGGWLVVDEAFADLEPGLSAAPLMPLPGLILLRSFGKTFGLAGVRLGFCIAGRDVIGPLKAEWGPWAVSGPAIGIGLTALADRRWRDEQGERLAAETLRLDGLLRQAGFTVVGGTRLFRLGRHPAGPEWFARLGRHGIWVRRFAEEPTWLRFGCPAGPEGWRRLAHALGLL